LALCRADPVLPCRQDRVRAGRGARGRPGGPACTRRPAGRECGL